MPILSEILSKHKIIDLNLDFIPKTLGHKGWEILDISHYNIVDVDDSFPKFTMIAGNETQDILELQYIMSVKPDSSIEFYLVSVRDQITTSKQDISHGFQVTGDYIFC